MKKKNQKYSFCVLGENYIKEQLTLIHKTSQKIKLTSNIEHLHKTRVASRKLNVGLSIFEQCIRKKIFKDFKKETSAIFKNLGIARDLDVQIQDLGEIAEKINSDEIRVGVNRLIWRKIQDRENFQPKLEKSLKKFLKNDFISRIDVLFKKKDNNENLTQNNFMEIFEKKGLKKSWDKWISKTLQFGSLQIENKTSVEIHQLRIKIKKLRYVLEIFLPVLDDSFVYKISTLKNLQEILGVIHDSDVWLNYLPKFLSEENKKTENFFGYIPSENSIDSGIEFLIKHHLENREIYFDKFLKEWNMLNSENFWNNILLRKTN